MLLFLTTLYLFSGIRDNELCAFCFTWFKLVSGTSMLLLFPPRIAIMRCYYMLLNWAFLTLSGRKLQGHERKFVHQVIEREKAMRMAGR